MKKILFYFPIILTLLFFSCEYPNEGEYFNKSVTPPNKEKLFAVELDINNPNLIITGPTQVFFKTETQGVEYDLTFYNGEPASYFMIGDRKLSISRLPDENSNVTKYYTYIMPAEFDEGIHELKLHMTTLTTGSGSLADKTLYERYEGDHFWQIEVFDLYNHGIEMMPLSHKVSKDGFLELTWDKPLLPDAVLLGYRVYWQDRSTSAERDTFITNNNQTSLIIKDYTCGEVEFYANAVVKGFNDLDQSWDKIIKYYGKLTLNEPLPIISIVNNFNGTVTANWKKGKYNASYKVIRDHSDQEKNSGYTETDTFVVLQKPSKLFIDNNYSLYIYPQGKGNTPNSPLSHNNTNVNISISTKYVNSLSTNVLGYSLKENTIVSVSNYTKLTTHQLPNCKLIYSWNIPQNETRVSVPTNSSRIVFLNGSEITVYKNSKLEKEYTIEVENSHLYSQNVKACNNNSFYHIRVESEGLSTYLILSMYDITNGKLIKTLKSEAVSSINPGIISISEDGKYLTISNSDKVSLYDLSGNNIVKLNEKEYSSIALTYIHPTNPNLLIVIRYAEGKIDFLNKETLETLKTITVGTKYNISLLNIDPYTGNLLVKIPQKHKIIGIESGDVIHEIEDDFESRLYGNILFSGDGRMYDFNKETIQK